MTDLRTLVRKSATAGAQMYAVVEHTALGMAAVRLATNGARFTNLRVVGQPVKVGQIVVVDSSAEGAPTVRPLTIAEPTIIDQLEEAPFVHFPEPGTELEDPPIPPPGEEVFEVVAGKVTRQATHVQTYTNTAYFRWDITLTHTLYDTHNLWDAATGTLQCGEQPGTYFVRYTNAIEPTNQIGTFISYVYRMMGYYTVRRAFSGTEPIICTFTGIFRYPADETSVPRARYGITDGIPSGYVSSVNMPVLANKYPIFEWWRISQFTSTAPEATPWWYF